MCMNKLKETVCRGLEILFGSSVIGFMKQHGYVKDEKYLRAVMNWRQAVDERGLSDEQRDCFCSEYLDYIISDLIPWYSSDKDFSQLEANRLV